MNRLNAEPNHPAPVPIAANNPPHQENPELNHPLNQPAPAHPPAPRRVINPNPPIFRELRRSARIRNRTLQNP